MVESATAHSTSPPKHCTLKSSRAPPPSTHPLSPLAPLALSPLSPSCHSSAMARTKQNSKKSTGGHATPASWPGSLPVKSKAPSPRPKQDHKRPDNSGNNDVGSLPRYQCGFH